MKAKWLERLIKKFGDEITTGASKHSRGKIKSKNWWQKRRKKQKQAKTSRRINR